MTQMMADGRKKTEANEVWHCLHLYANFENCYCDTTQWNAKT
jgi:hypothetical protein